MPERFNRVLRSALLASRWIMAPLCLGLIAALVINAVGFFRELIQAVTHFGAMHSDEVILDELKLVDLVLVANLLLMILTAAIEIFLPASADRSHSEGIANFAALKPKLFASISAIAAIDLLETFVNIEGADKSSVVWEVVILLAFVVAGVLLAWMDRIEPDKH